MSIVIKMANKSTMDIKHGAVIMKNGIPIIETLSCNEWNRIPIHAEENSIKKLEESYKQRKVV